MTENATDLVPIAVPGTDINLMAQLVGQKPFIILKPICDGLGIDEDAQRRKLAQADWATTSLITAVAADGRTREMTAVDADCLPMWLVTIQPSRVAEHVRPALVALQREAAHALRDYFYNGGAINPRATEDQLGRVITQAQAQAGVLAALRGIVDPRHLETKGRLVLARALGEAPELDPLGTPLYVWNYLQEKGLPRGLVQAKASGFGKRLKALYIVEHDRAPEMHHQEMPDGKIREACAYTEADRALFDRVWARHYANEVAA